jgi:hypothetical protein
MKSSIVSCSDSEALTLRVPMLSLVGARLATQLQCTVGVALPGAGPAQGSQGNCIVGLASIYRGADRPHGRGAHTGKKAVTQTASLRQHTQAT